MASREEQTENWVERFYSSTSTENVVDVIEEKRRQLEQGGFLSSIFADLQRLLGGMALETVADLGGYDGTNIFLLRDYLNIKRAVCVDEYVPTRKVEGIEFVEANIERIPEIFPKESVDLIILMEVIEHLVDPDDVLQKIREALKPDGFLLVTTPNLSCLTNRLALLAGLVPLGVEVSSKACFGRPGTFPGHVSGHLRLFTFRAMGEFLNYYGFSVIHSFTLPLRVDNHYPSRKLRLMETATNVLERIAVNINSALGFKMVFVARKKSNR